MHWGNATVQTASGVRAWRDARNWCGGDVSAPSACAPTAVPGWTDTAIVRNGGSVAVLPPGGRGTPYVRKLRVSAASTLSLRGGAVLQVRQADACATAWC